jgi:UDP-GlcNAc3NAcA epimerase
VKKIISIIGARPQFIKHAPVEIALQKEFTSITIHTGQHYDANMSTVFFEELGMSKPNYIFDLGDAKLQGAQTATMMIEIEKVCNAEQPDAVLIYGDTNSTLAAALVAVKNHIPIIHIEAGLRSYNREMPEEINRIVADEFSHLLFCPNQNAIENLKKEGITHNRIFECGDVMCDMIHLIKPKLNKKYNEPYYFATIHRPYNTDDKVQMLKILNAFNGLDKKVVFAIHPRTSSKIESYGIKIEDYTNIICIAPQGYVDSISLQNFSSGVITDSGGVQKEAYILEKKCITLRKETEWIETLDFGWNHLLFDDFTNLQELIKITPTNHNATLYGDGNAAEQIVAIIKKSLAITTKA